MPPLLFHVSPLFFSPPARFRYLSIQFVGLVGRVFADGPGDLGSIQISNTLKMVLDASLLNTQQYKVRMKGKVNQSKKGVAPSLTPRCSSYWKGSLWVAFDYGRQLYFIFIPFLTEALVTASLLRSLGLYLLILAVCIIIIMTTTTTYIELKWWYINVFYYWGFIFSNPKQIRSWIYIYIYI